jgi:hypothetical protein
MRSACSVRPGAALFRRAYPGGLPVPVSEESAPDLDIALLCCKRAPSRKCEGFEPRHAAAATSPKDWYRSLVRDMSRG